jgi:hypothetical protein
MLDMVDPDLAHATPAKLHAAGDMGNGDYRCSECGYGIVVLRVLPTCPMCRGQEWIEREAAPFRHAVGQ